MVNGWGGDNMIIQHNTIKESHIKRKLQNPRPKLSCLTLWFTVQSMLAVQEKINIISDSIQASLSVKNLTFFHQYQFEVPLENLKKTFLCMFTDLFPVDSEL